jgi:hypothetical protein
MPIFYLNCLLIVALWGGIFTCLSRANADERNADEHVTQSIDVTTFEHNGAQYVAAKTLVYFTPQYFLDLMLASNENCSWMDKCVSVTVLAKPATAEKLIQTHLDAPWPFKDRDMVVSSRTEYNKTTNTLRIVIEDASSEVPHHPHRVRMTEVHGEWEIKPCDGGPEHAFELSYKGTANPNGYIPRALALSILKASTRQTFANLQAHQP